VSPGAASGAPDDHRADPRLELLVVTSERTSVHPLPALGSLVIGRGEDCDVRVEARSVSRRHAVVHVGPTLRIEDLGSSNGTFVRDTLGDAAAAGATAATQRLRQLCKETIEVAIGDCVNLGSATVLVRRTARADTGAPGEATVVVDAAMVALHDQARRAARSPISVLLLGETGVGKEVLARAIHDASPRAGAPFLGLNCAALGEQLLESELFGHEKGAFTGAVVTKPGLFETAHGGTIFLDEVGELPAATQARLLRVLEDRAVLRVGGRAPRPVDVRFLAATNRDLEEQVARGVFRRDLFFRLNGVAFTIPPLRARTAEVAPLAAIFLRRAAAQLDRAQPPLLSPEALALLEQHSWPGNVRELRNAIERSVALCTGGVITPADLPPSLAHRAPVASPPSAPVEPAARGGGLSGPAATGASLEVLRREMDALQRQRVIDALERAGGNQKEAAALLGISRRTLISRIEQYDLPRPRKRS
jgi:DNA-binding NtrC family response regulator